MAGHDQPHPPPADAPGGPADPSVATLAVRPVPEFFQALTRASLIPIALITQAATDHSSHGTHPRTHLYVSAHHLFSLCSNAQWPSARMLVFYFAEANTGGPRQLYTPEVVLDLPPANGPLHVCTLGKSSVHVALILMFHRARSVFVLIASVALIVVTSLCSLIVGLAL